MDRTQSDRSLRVVHVVFSLNCGGLERVVLDLIRGGLMRQQQSAVICLERPGVLAVDAQALGAAVLCTQKTPGIDISLWGRLRKVMDRWHPDVVHTHQIGALFYAGNAARALGVRAIVHTEHGVHYRSRLRTRWLARYAAKRAHRFCCVSDEIASDVDRFRLAKSDRIHVIRNGIDTTRFIRVDRAESLRGELGIPATAIVVGTVGRLSEIKRQDVLIRGFSRLRARLADAHLLLVGEGPCRLRLTELVQHLGLANCVHFAGYQTQTERYLQAMDVFALTSRSEGMPLAVLEAWAVGLPVVASRVGGLPELIEDGQNGLLFSCGDDHELAAKLERVLCDRSLADRLGAAGQQSARSKYDVMTMVDAYYRHYLQLLQENDTNHHAHPCDHKFVSEPLSASTGDV